MDEKEFKEYMNLKYSCDDLRSQKSGLQQELTNFALNVERLMSREDFIKMAVDGITFDNKLKIDYDALRVLCARAYEIFI